MEDVKAEILKMKNIDTIELKVANKPPCSQEAFVEEAEFMLKCSHLIPSLTICTMPCESMTSLFWQSRLFNSRVHVLRS